MLKMVVYMITAMYYRVCMAPDSDLTEKRADLVPAQLLQTSPVYCKTNEHIEMSF